MSSLISSSILEEADPHFLVYFTVQLEKLVGCKNLKLTRMGFKRLMAVIWGMCEKYVYDNYQSCRQELGFEAEWLVLEVFDFGMGVKKKEMLEFLLG